MVDIDEEMKIDEEPGATILKNIARFVVDKVKEKKNQKYVTLKSSMKDTKVVKEKTP